MKIRSLNFLRVKKGRINIIPIFIKQRKQDQPVTNCIITVATGLLLLSLYPFLNAPFYPYVKLTFIILEGKLDTPPQSY